MSIISKQNDQLGTDTYRVEDANIPTGFRETTKLTVAESTRKPNPGAAVSRNSSVITERPVVRTVDGLTVSTDKFVVTSKFTALQHITEATARKAAFRNHVAFLIESETAIIEGNLPINAVPDAAITSRIAKAFA